MKKFLIQIQPGPDTRFNLDPDLLAHLIAREVGRILEANTSGPVPLVSVLPEEMGAPLLPVDRCTCPICRPTPL